MYAPRTEHAAPTLRVRSRCEVFDVWFLSWLAAAGYILLGSFYAISGLLHFRHFRELTGALAARGAPFPAATLAAGSVFQTVAGALLAAQVPWRWPAFGLALFTLLASLLFFDFWRREDVAREAAIRAWQTNLGLIGALLVIGSG